MGMMVIARLPLVRKFWAPAENSAGALFASGTSTILQSSKAAPCMYSRERGVLEIVRRHASARSESRAATAAASILSPYLSARLMSASGKSFRTLCTMASNTGCVSLGELLMIFRISAVAACCSKASFNSRLRRATFFSSLAEEKLFRCGVFDTLRRLGGDGLRRRFLGASSPPALERRLIASPEAQDKA